MRHRVLIDNRSSRRQDYTLAGGPCTRSLIETLGVPPVQMAYIADNEGKDFIAPNRLGMFTVQVLRPARLRAGAWLGPEAVAKVRIEHLNELSAALRRL
jgi:FMN phosphatase YigB (HAD superfamily)